MLLSVARRNVSDRMEFQLHMAPMERITVASRRVVACQCRALYGEPSSKRHGQQLSEPGHLSALPSFIGKYCKMRP